MPPLPSPSHSERSPGSTWPARGSRFPRRWRCQDRRGDRTPWRRARRRRPASSSTRARAGNRWVRYARARSRRAENPRPRPWPHEPDPAVRSDRRRRHLARARRRDRRVSQRRGGDGGARVALGTTRPTGVADVPRVSDQGDRFLVAVRGQPASSSMRRETATSGPARPPCSSRWRSTRPSSPARAPVVRHGAAQQVVAPASPAPTPTAERWIHWPRPRDSAGPASNTSAAIGFEARAAVGWGWLGVAATAGVLAPTESTFPSVTPPAALSAQRRGDGAHGPRRLAVAGAVGAALVPLMSAARGSTGISNRCAWMRASGSPSSFAFARRRGWPRSSTCTRRSSRAPTSWMSIRSGRSVDGPAVAGRFGGAVVRGRRERGSCARAAGAG